MEARPLWKEILDTQTNKFYYWDPLSNLIRWTIPDSQWRKFRDPKTGKSFYCHTETQQVTWSVPIGVTIPDALETPTIPGPPSYPPPSVSASQSRPASPPTNSSRSASPTFNSPRTSSSSSSTSSSSLPVSSDSSSSSSSSSTSSLSSSTSSPPSESREVEPIDQAFVKSIPPITPPSESTAPTSPQPKSGNLSPTNRLLSEAPRSPTHVRQTTGTISPPPIRSTSPPPIRRTGSISPTPPRSEPPSSPTNRSKSPTTPFRATTTGNFSPKSRKNYSGLAIDASHDYFNSDAIQELAESIDQVSEMPSSPKSPNLLTRSNSHRRVLSTTSIEKKFKNKENGHAGGSESKSPLSKTAHGRVLSWGGAKPTKIGLNLGGLKHSDGSEPGSPTEEVPPPPPLYLALPHIAPRFSELPEAPVEKLGTPRHPLPTSVELRKKSPWFRAINDYHPEQSTTTASEFDEYPLLSFDLDDVIQLIHKTSSEWWVGQVVGIVDSPIGKFPSQYVVDVDSKVASPEVPAVVLPEETSTQPEKFSLNNKIREIVSKKKRRFKQDGFNLDLSYITNSIIAMGFPSKKIEGIYRNHIKDVQRFLNENHPKSYRIYNLCSEREYNPNKFEGRVARYPFDDHNPCPFEMIETFCEDVHSWLTADNKNVIAIHCKAGKGRTGFMVACYLLYSQLFSDPDNALRYFAVKRTHNEKGVTIPSQRRYTWYFHEMLRRRRNLLPALPSINPLYLESISIRGIPYGLRSTQTPDLYFEIEGGENKFNSLNKIKPYLLGDTIFFGLKQINFLKLDWDIKFNFYSKKLQVASGVSGFGYEKLFHFWVNLTFCETDVCSIEMGTLKPPTSPYRRRVLLIKSQIDKAIKDKNNKLFPQSMCVELLFKTKVDPTPTSDSETTS